MTRDPSCTLCGGAPCQHGEQSDPELFELDRRVAEAVRVEREACASLCEWLDVNESDDLISANEAAAAIRARGGA